MFYFYKVYRFKADAKDPDFFSSQKETFCQWNEADPVDDRDLAPSHLVADFQKNENPFVIDSTLVDTAYCQ